MHCNVIYDIYKDPRTTLPENLIKSQDTVSYHGHFTNFLDFNICIWRFQSVMTYPVKFQYFQH